MSANATVLLTRPAGRNESLVTRLTEQGIASLVVPGLQLVSRDGEPDAYLAPDHYDALVFVSGHAARVYFQLMEQAGHSLAAHHYLASVGQPTAKALSLLPGVQKQQLIYPHDNDSLQDSEALWACLLPYLHTWRRVLIVRGESGREWLGARLEKMGLRVDRLAVYRRIPAIWPVAQQEALRALYTQLSPLCLLSSSESVRAIAYNMKQLALLEQWARSYFIVIHPRIEAALQTVLNEAGITHPIVVKRCTPTDDSIIEAIMAVLSPDEPHTDTILS